MRHTVADHQARYLRITENTVIRVLQVAVQIDNSSAAAKCIVADGVYVTRKRQLCKSRTFTESIIHDGLQGRGKAQCRNGGAVLESMLANSFHTFLYHYLTELGSAEWTHIPACIRNVALHIHLARTSTENSLAECLEARRKLRSLEIRQALKGILANRLHTLGDHHLGQTRTAHKGVI